MKIVPVTSARESKDFLQLPRFIYSNDKNWVPHLRQDIEKVFDPKKNKAFKDGEIERWIVKIDDKVVGRIAAFIQKKYSDGMEQKTGGIGFFECIDDREVAFALFDQALVWLKENQMEAVDGPINFGEKNMFWGLLIENYTAPNVYGTNYHPPYYRAFFDDYGFQIYYNQYCFRRKISDELRPEVIQKAATALNSPDYTFSDIRGISKDKLAEMILTVYNNSWGGHHGFKKMRMEQVQSMLKSMYPIMDKKIIFFCYYKGDPIGFFINIPEINEYFKHINGNLNLWGKLVFMYHKTFKPSKIMSGLVFGIDRAHHKKGLESAMSVWSRSYLMENTSYTDITITWIGDFNPKMMSVIAKLETEKYRTLATYRYLFDRNKTFERSPDAV